MIQPCRRRWLAVFVASIFLCGCDTSFPTAPASDAGEDAITVASLSPAFTEMILSMGGGGRLVAVSNFEPPRPATDPLPRVGDYRTVDWEKLTRIAPKLILTQYDAGKLPDGLVERAATIGARVLNIDIDTLADVESALRQIASAMGLPESGESSAGRFRAELDALADKSARRPRVPALVVIGPGGLAVVGPGNFVDEMLHLAGGQNVITDGPDFANIDREKLLALDPPVILQFLPSATPQVIDQAEDFWRQMSPLTAVRNGRVHRITDDDALLPATNAARIARRMSEALHGTP